MTSRILDLIADDILTVRERVEAMEALMADFAQMKSAVSAMTGIVASMQAQMADLQGQIDNASGERQAAIDAAVADAVAAHDVAIQSEIDGITAEIVNATPALG